MAMARTKKTGKKKPPGRTARPRTEYDLSDRVVFLTSPVVFKALEQFAGILEKKEAQVVTPHIVARRIVHTWVMEYNAKIQAGEVDPKDPSWRPPI
jgi:hypothetical protein